jgi:predicted DNA-binding ribbon-helix-helix protein
MARTGSKKPKAVVPELKVISGGKSAAQEKNKPLKEQKAKGRSSQGKRVQFDLETWHALNMLARDRMMTFQELADEAFDDLLRKHGRPTDLKDALRRSLKDAGPQPQRRSRKTKPRDDDH